eukprot:Pgem_evm1s8474
MGKQLDDTPDIGLLNDAEEQPMHMVQKQNAGSLRENDFPRGDAEDQNILQSLNARGAAKRKQK